MYFFLTLTSLPTVVVQDHWSSRGREGNDTKSKNLHIYLFIYLFNYVAYIICKYIASINFAMLVVLHAMF